MSLLEASRDPEMAKRYADLAWQISTRFNVRLSEKRSYYCRKCKSFIAVPGGARYRLGGGGILRITCLKCGRTYRKNLRPSSNIVAPVHKRLNSAHEKSPLGHS